MNRLSLTRGAVGRLHLQDRRLGNTAVSRPSYRFRLIAFLVLIACHGCASDQSASTGNAKSRAEVQMPESEPPVLTRAVADRIHTGMTQEKVLAIVRDAGRGTPSASMLEAAYTQGMLSTLNHELTVTQGRRRLGLVFKSAKLVEKTVEGMD